jgi:hypothetical protein
MRRRTPIVALGLFAGLALLAACGPTPAEQRAMDQNSCAGYGFTPGTDAFANCMMTTAQRRANAEQRRADQAAADRRQQAMISANLQALSIARNGDKRYPVCNAASKGATLDVPNSAWYGVNCREK